MTDDQLADLRDAALCLARYAEATTAAAEAIVRPDGSVDPAELANLYQVAEANLLAGVDVRPWTEMRAAHRILAAAAPSPL